MLKVYSIYGIISPETHEIVYIGKTFQTIEKRLSAHLMKCRTVKPKTSMDMWVAEMYQKGLVKSVMAVIIQDSILSASECARIELEYIKKYRLTHKLLNHQYGRKKTVKEKVVMTMAEYLAYKSELVQTEKA